MAERIFGYSAGEIVGQTVDILMPEEERADHWHSYRRVMATNIMNYTPDHIFDIEGVRQDGSRVPLDAMLKAIRDATGRIIVIMAIMRGVGIQVVLPQHRTEAAWSAVISNVTQPNAGARGSPGQAPPRVD